jgi:hypothetical protein
MTKLNALLAAACFGAFTITAGPARADERNAPQTAEEHQDLAQQYRKKAVEFRKEVEWHKDMAAAYKRQHPDAKGGRRNPWTVKMEKHCQTMARNAEKLATESEKAADFHDLRAKELQGK